MKPPVQMLNLFEQQPRSLVPILWLGVFFVHLLLRTCMSGCVSASGFAFGIGIVRFLLIYGSFKQQVPIHKGRGLAMATKDTGTVYWQQSRMMQVIWRWHSANVASFKLHHHMNKPEVAHVRYDYDLFAACQHTRIKDF